MFLDGTTKYGKRGGQSHRGNFLILALPRTRDPQWVEARRLVRSRLQRKCEDLGRESFYWKDYLTDEEKELRYDEELYHPPFAFLRGAVVKVTLTQVGHFMMGGVRSGVLGGTHLSGTYGGDGLPKTLDRQAWAQMLPLPVDLCDTIAKGDGHNSAGSEAPSVQKWARDNLPGLRKCVRAWTYDAQP
jgi:hypothetical protein